MKLMDHMLRWSGILLMLLTLGALLSPVAPPRPFWPFSILGLLFPGLILGLLLLVVYWLLRRKRHFFLPLLCLLLSWGHISKLFNARIARPASAEHSLSVMSYNLQNLWTLREQMSRQKTWQAFFRQQSPDILCLQESSMNSKEGRRLDAFFRKELALKHRHVDPHNSGLAIYARFPIEADHSMNFENNSNGFMYVDLKIDDRLLRVYNLHLQSNQVTQSATRVMNEGSLQEKETWLDIREMLRRYKRAAQKRADQAELIAANLHKCRHPALLCGDFNDTPLSHAYYLLSENLCDGFRQAGSGQGRTYRGGIPGLRIDYIFSPKGLPPVDYRTHCVELSDHCAVTATFPMAAK